MRTIWLIFGGLLLLLLGLRFALPRHAPGPAARPEAAPLAVVLVGQRSASPRPALAGQADSIVRFALRQLGTPYTWAGTSPLTGFDCSGFITYVFGRFGVATPHATALLIEAGRPVPRAQARPGDIVVFTGTAEGSTTPGHAGIVISALGETPLRFVHASSARREAGVKISQVENSDYERRFMQVRRVLGAGPASPLATTASRPAPAGLPARPAGAVAPLPAAAPRVTVNLAGALPARVAPLAVRLRPRARASARVKTPAATKRAAPARRAAMAKKSAGKKALPALPRQATAKNKKPATAAKKAAKAPARPRLRPRAAKQKSR